MMAGNAGAWFVVWFGLVGWGKLVHWLCLFCCLGFLALLAGNSG